MQVQDNLRIYPTSCDPIGSPHIPTITKCMYDSAGGSPAWHANPHIPCQILGRSLGVEVKSYHRSYGLPVLVTRWEPSTCNCRTSLFSTWWHATPRGDANVNMVNTQVETTSMAPASIQRS